MVFMDPVDESQAQDFIKPKDCRIPLKTRSGKNLQIEKNSCSGMIPICASSNQKPSPGRIGSGSDHFYCPFSRPPQ
jgi:hypothetical protein